MRIKETESRLKELCPEIIEQYNRRIQEYTEQIEQFKRIAPEKKAAFKQAMAVRLFTDLKGLAGIDAGPKAKKGAGRAVK